MLPEAIKSHLPLIALAAVSAVVIFYLYRELNKAKRALVAERSEECTSALCDKKAKAPAKRVRFEGDAGSSAAEAKPQAAAGKGAHDPAAPPTAAGSTAKGAAFESGK